MISAVKKGALAGLLCAGALAAQAQTQLSPSWILKADTGNTDQVTAIWTNPNGDSYVTGHVNLVPPGANAFETGVMTIKVNTQGQEVWRKLLMPPVNNRLNPKGITGDEQGNTYILYSQSFKYVDSTVSRLIVRKYDADGNTLWNRFVTAYADGLVEDAATREFRYANGHLYACGSTFGNPTNPLDGLVYKLNATDGSITWRFQYNSPYNTDDVFRALALDASGNLWAVGRSRGYAGPGGIYSDYDAVVVHISNSGTQQWEYRLNGSGNSDDIGLGVTADAAGNSYLSGQIDILGVSSDSVVVEKISPMGQRIWRYGFMGSNTGSNYKQPLLLQPNGNVAGTSTTANGIRTFSLNPANGTVIWTAIHNRDNQGAGDHPMEMIQDADGNLYLAATTRVGTGQLSDVTTLKYSSAGALEWYCYYTEPHVGSQEDGVSLALDGSNNVYTIGWVQNAQHNADYYLSKHGNNPVISGAESGLVENALQVYPNPASQVVQINSGTEKLTSVILLNSVGQRVWESAAANTHFRIGVNQLPAGIFFLQAKTANGQLLSRKLVIVP